MPPKKRRSALSPIVVGTVSTRSTRRQSIVNIDIPKLSKSPGKNVTKSPNSAGTKETMQVTAADILSEKIKQTYNKVFKTTLSKSPTNILRTPAARKDYTSEFTSPEKSNDALLQILEDWTDDESQDAKKEIAAEVPIKTEKSEVTSPITGNATEEKLDTDYSQINEAVTIEMDLDNVNNFKVENLETETEVVHEYIIEENETVPIEEHVVEIVAFEEENVECVTEEIVTDENEQYVLMDTSEDNTVTVVETNELEIESSLEEMNKEAITENLITEETSLSVSTSDSNDAEVRSFFTKEIEENKTVKEEDIPNLDCVDASSCDIEKALEGVHGVETIAEVSQPNDKSNETGIVSETELVESLVKASEPMDVSDSLNEDTIESRVAQMHLMDEVVQESCENLSSQLNLVDLTHCLNEDKEEVIVVKTSTKEAKDDNDISESVKARKAKSARKAVGEQNVKTVKAKDKRPVKAKEIKPKELKPVKETKSKKIVLPPPPVKKPKEKVEKKDTAKKSVKVESEQLKKLPKADSFDLEDIEVRRSSRIKSISVLKKKTTGHGLVRSKSEPILNESDISDSNSTCAESEKSTPSASPKVLIKERKTRWAKSTENLSCDPHLAPATAPTLQSEATSMEVDEKPKLPVRDPVVTARLKQFVHLKENMYKTDRMTCKEAKKMTCDCFLTTEEVESDEYGCGEDCLNRLLLIECGSLCQVADRCTNKRFQKGQFAPVEVFNTEKKGLGLRAAANIPYGEFILEYVGEVLNCNEFDKRAEVYSQDKNIHYYFMSLRADAIIDATMKGNISRFINHSCDPNAETQKWTVNGELRIGFFSTRTILAGEEITFDYRFQRYGKEAQKCYCEATTCRGWLGEQPDEDSEDEEEEDEEEEEAGEVKTEQATLEVVPEELEAKVIAPEVKVEQAESEAPAPTTPKRKSTRKKPRKDLFEELDQLDEEIDMLVTTGLKNQAHTLKLSRLMVRAKEPPQRTKLLRILRRGELPCRRLFLDYHGLRLMHGYMIDAQHLVHNDKKFESLRLEMLQTLAVLPIPNKTMLQDSKVLPTVEKWATDKDLGSPQDSDSSSPKEPPLPNTEPLKKPALELKKEDGVKLERSIEDQEEEIRFLASKLIEGWANLKEVFRIPKKERIEQMKEHEREANKKFMQGGYTHESDSARKSDRYRHWSRSKSDREFTGSSRKGSKSEKPSAEYIRLSKIERRKLFALQHELKEEERRMKQRELWRQHEVNCLLIGTDPRFTAPFDPSRGGFQCIWNPQIGQWQNYPLPAQNPVLFTSQVPAPNVPNLNVPPPHLQAPKPVHNYPYAQQIAIASSVHVQQQSLANGMQGIPGALPQNIPTHPQIATVQPPLPQYQESIKQEEDPSQVIFLGPIPPPAKLPPKWKCAKDKYGRPYYYHVKLRKSQWEPPPPPPEPAEEPDESSESESSSDTSTVSTDSSSENSDSDDDIDDTRLLMEVRRQMEKSAKLTLKPAVVEPVKVEVEPTFSPDEKISDEEEDEEEEEEPPLLMDEDVERPSIDIRLKEQFSFLKDDNPPRKKRRTGLCEEIMISPRTEEDRLQFKEDLKRYKANKEKLKRQKELILQQTKKQLRESDSRKLRDKRARAALKTRIKEMPDFNSEHAKKIKESFRANMASTVVGSLNAYRKPDCKEGRITNTDDFKHLARKLTHFVMLKEMKHIEKIEDLTCTDNVKSKAREYIKKYMGKFGEVYVKRNDSPDFKD